MFFFFKQKTAYEMRISDWSSDVCSSDLDGVQQEQRAVQHPERGRAGLRLGLIRFALQQGLGELQVPVAVGVPDELVERLRRLVEAVVLEIGRASCRERVCQYV